MRIALRAVLAIVMATLVVAASAAHGSLTGAGTVHVYTYDNVGAPGACHDSTPERGPPTAHDHLAAQRAVDFRSNGASACPEPTTTYGYDAPLQLVQFDNVRTTTAALGSASELGLRVVPSAMVAAKTADDWPVLSGIVRDAAKGRRDAEGHPGHRGR
ncbi:hypothetical protein [Jiangella anatolica]|uniref:hypothetical protein n=1 Tax=Jiangella anatolica TaxID=2670374 RepID=UPI0018F7B9D0|nr:hypothetical protein [Jiangella anatolica]